MVNNCFFGIVFFLLFNTCSFAVKDTLFGKNIMESQYHLTSVWLNPAAHPIKSNQNKLTVNLSYLYGRRILNKPDKRSVYLKTGIELLFPRNNLFPTDSAQQKVREGFISVPLMWSANIPLQCFNCNNRTPFATISFGFYAATLMKQEIAVEDFDFDETQNFGGYIKFGFIADAAIQFLTDKGQGHVIGLRMAYDFNDRTFYKANDNVTTASYYSLGLYYNFINGSW